MSAAASDQLSFNWRGALARLKKKAFAPHALLSSAELRVGPPLCTSGIVRRELLLRSIVIERDEID